MEERKLRKSMHEYRLTLVYIHALVIYVIFGSRHSVIKRILSLKSSSSVVRQSYIF
jgi:hypothetical protein